jgi:hypothetical protein
MKKILIILIPLSLLILVGNIWLVSCQTSVPATALITGAVTIGPITPVEQPGQCPPVPPEVFSSRKIMIYNESGDKLLQQVNINQIGQTANGYYTILIAPGTYTIDINHAGIDSADNLPQKITIPVNETVTIDVNIDTGIR